MFPPDENEYNTSLGPIDRAARSANRREIINEKRNRNTDMLPKVQGESANSKNMSRHIAQLREENKRLRWEIDEQHHIIHQHRQTQAQLEQEIDNLDRSKQNEIEQYEIHLREAIDECNQLQEYNQELKRRYLELDQTFHEIVSEEANKMVEEAANTIVLTPEHTPALLQNVAKTVELHVKQTEDQYIAELLSLMRQAQYKTDQLEQELSYERDRIAAERQTLLVQQAKISEQAQYRYKTIQQHLKARLILFTTLMVAALLILVPIFQLIFVSMKVQLYVAIFVPVIICIGIAFLIARVYSNKKMEEANKKIEQKASTTASKKTIPIPAAKKA